MTSMEYQGRIRFETMELILRHETIGRCLGSHDRWNLVTGLRYATGCHKWMIRPHTLSHSKTECSTLIDNAVIYRAVT